MNNLFPRNLHPQARGEDVLTQNTEDEILVYDLITKRAFYLNSVASNIWLQCDGNRNISQIIEVLQEKYQTDSNEELIRLTISELARNNLLVKTEELNQLSRSFNRRETIKRIGLTTAFALPVISSLLVPTAANAQSQTQQAFCNINCDASTPNSCNCTAGSYPCPNGGLITIDASAGVCLGASIGITIPGIPINVGLGVCVYTGICVTV